MAEEDRKSTGNIDSGNVIPIRKLSFSDNNNNVHHLRRYSTSSQKITPHHRMASSGSCHDLCKYGLKPDYEENEKRPWMKKKMMKTSSGKHNSIGTVAPTKLKKSSLARSLSCPFDMSHLVSHETSSVSVAVSSPRPRKIIKGEMMMMKPRKLIEVSSKQDPSSGHKAEKKVNRSSKKVNVGSSSSQSVKSRLLSSMQTVESIKETAAISKEALKSSKRISKIPRSINKRRDDEKISEANVMERSKKKDDVLTRKNMTSKKRLASTGSSRHSIGGKTAMERGIVGSLKPVSSLKDQNRMLKKEIRKTGKDHVAEKTLHVVEIETKPKLSESTEVKDIIPLIPPQPNLSLVSPMVISLPSHEEVGGVGKEVVVDEIKLEAEEKEEGEEEEEHTDEHEVEQEEDEEEDEEEEEQQIEDDDEEEMETEGDDDYDSDSDYDSEEEENVDECEEGDESITGNMRKPLRKGDAISDPGESVQVFRKGKVLDIHSENKTPRRLRFRKARIVEENHDDSKNQISRRKFTRRSGRKAANSNNPDDQKVILRHQDLQEKKDEQGLSLNNVIGETANRLVESRKSKVKALVGAFETVISLHDRKPSAQLAA